MFGRCGAPTGGSSVTVTYHSDGTLLERPLSPELLNDLTSKLIAQTQGATVFGLAVRYVGPNALVMMDVASPQATIEVGAPDVYGRVLVMGEIFGDFVSARAVCQAAQGFAGARRWCVQQRRQ